MPSALDICNQALIDVGVRDLMSSFADDSPQAIICQTLFKQTVEKVNAECWWPFTEKHGQLAQVAAPYPAWVSATAYTLAARVTYNGLPGYFVSLASNNVGNVPNVNGSTSWTYVPTYSRTGWNYMYALPTDCVDVRWVQWQPLYGTVTFPAMPPIPQPAQMRTQLPDSRPEWKVTSDDASDGNNFLVTNMFAAEVIYTMSLVQNAVLVFPPLFSDCVSWRMAYHLAMGVPNKADYAKNAKAMYDIELSKAVARALNSGELQHERKSQFIHAR